MTTAERSSEAEATQEYVALSSGLEFISAAMSANVEPAGYVNENSLV